MRLSPSGSYQITLTFDASGSYRSEIISYGLYNHSPDEISAYTYITGTWHARQDSLSVRTERMVWWDIFYGAGSPEHVMSYVGTAYDKARYTIDGDRLTLDYLSYPADAPVATTATFVRVR